MVAPALPSTSAPAGTSLVAADVGTVYTKAFLIDDVEGERRLVAVGRAPTVCDDGQARPQAALAQAMAQALAHAGRPAGEAPALDVCLTSASALPRIAVVAPGSSEILALSRALEGQPLTLLAPLALDGPGADPEQLLAHLETQSPDAVVVGAGSRPADRLLAVAAVEAISRGFGVQAPAVVLAGDEEFIAAASMLVAAEKRFDAPGGRGESVRDTIRALTRHRLGQGWAPDYRPAEPAAAHFVSSLDGVCAATEFIADRYDVDVLTLDLGAAHALAVSATGTSGHRRLVAAARDDLGLRFGRRTILQTAGVDALTRWLPIDVDEQTLRFEARRCAAVPAGLPETVDTLQIEHAFAREALRLVAADLASAYRARDESTALPQVDLLIGSGGALAGVPRLMQAALILLDAIQPEALTQLALDRATALPLIGQLSLQEGGAAVGAALERDGLLNLGLCVAPLGTGREGELAIKVEVAYANRAPVVVEVPFGAIEVVPLPIGERASLKLWPERDFDVGLGRGAAATPRAEVEGGAVGIIVDARGRPLAMPGSAEKRQAKLLQWLQSTRAYPPLSFVHVQADSGPAGGAR